MKFLKELNYDLKINHKLLLGTNEENDLIGMEYYIKHNKMPIASFTADAEFPCVNSEKGDIRGLAYLPLKNKYFLKGGNAVNIVISSFDVKVDLPIKQLEFDFKKYLKINKLTGDIGGDEKQTTIHVNGISSHGSLPELGVNAATHAINFLSNYFDEPAFNFIASKFHNNFGQSAIDGTLNEKHDKVSINVGVVESDVDKLKLHIDIRYAQGSKGQDVKDT
jgi:acetylornithine deacetylase/succinyl-diaminopimelate desuccinylase-like protein